MLQKVYVELARLGVDLHRNVVIFHVVIFFYGNDNGVFDFFQQVFCRKAALGLQHGKRFKKFRIHFSRSSSFLF